MDLDEAFTLSLTAEEIEWILQSLQAPFLRLYSPLAPDQSTAGIQKAPDVAKTSLEERGWLRLHSDEQARVDMTVAGIVGVLGFAEKALFTRQFREQDLQPRVRRYFSAEGLIVEQHDGEKEGEITLTALRNLETLRRRLIEYLDLREQRAPAEYAFRCEEEVFAAVPYILAGDGKPAAVAHLVETGAEESLARDLVQAMACPLRQTTLEALELDPDHPDGIRPRDKLTLLEGTYGLWVLNTRLDEDPVTIDILTCDADRAKNLVSGRLEFLTA